MKIVCLVGGGAKNIYTAGMVKYLHEIDYVPDVVLAASGGGLTAALWAQGDIALLEKLWLGIRNKDVRQFKPWMAFTRAACVFDFAPLRQTLKKHIDLQKLKKSPFDLFLALTSLHDGSAQRFNLKTMVNQDAVISSLMASASIPGFVSPINDFVDGGCADDQGILAALRMLGASMRNRRFEGFCPAIEYKIPHDTDEDGVLIPHEITVLHPGTFHDKSKPCNALEASENGIALLENANYLLQKSLVPDGILFREIFPSESKPISVFDFEYRGYERAALIQDGFEAAKKVFTL